LHEVSSKRRYIAINAFPILLQFAPEGIDSMA